MRTTSRPGSSAPASGGGQLASIACPATSPHQWFTGVGAAVRATTRSWSWSTPTPVRPSPTSPSTPAPARSTSRACAASRCPGTAASGSTSARSRPGAASWPCRWSPRVAGWRYSVLDSSDELGRGQASQDWLPGQQEPTTDNVLLGLGAGRGRSPPDARQRRRRRGARPRCKFVSEDSVFAPEGIDEIRVPPQGVARVSLTDALQSAIADGVVGLEVTSTQPVTATLRTFADGDLSHAVSVAADPARRLGDRADRRQAGPARGCPGRRRRHRGVPLRHRRGAGPDPRRPAARARHRRHRAAAGHPGVGRPREHERHRVRDRLRPGAAVVPLVDPGPERAGPRRPPRDSRSLSRSPDSYLGSTSSASMPSSSATCSTTTVSTMASRSVRVSQRCSMGRRNRTRRVGVRAGAADERGERHRPRVPVVGDLRRVLDGVLHQAEAVLPALVDVGHDAQREVVEALPGGPQLGPPGVAGHHGRPAHARVHGGPGAGARRSGESWRRPRREPNRGRGTRAGTVSRVSPVRRCSRTACGRPAVNTLTYVYADQTAVLGPARDLRRAARLRPVRRAQRAALGARAAGRCCAWRPTRRPRARPATTCSPSPTRCARPPGRRRSRCGPSPAAETGREVGRRGHLRVLSTD